ncbi:MAG TPA: glycosyltransferase [Candidatus Binatia bacterium]|nr:glycosyltransferase [Candidatus Binatia bacterium]
MTGDRRVSVVILTHGRCEECLRTVARFVAGGEAARVIVVDNASPDGTAARVRARFPAVEVVALRRNLGAAARNLGVRRAETPYVALADDDTWWARGALGRAADLLDAHPRLAVVSARVLVGPEEREDPTCVRLAESPLPPARDLPGVPILGFLAGASMVRRAAFLAAGGFEARLFLGGEEELLALDLGAAGWAMAYVPAVVVHHHPSPRRDPGARRRLLVRNALWCAWLRRPVPSALRQTLCILRAAHPAAAALAFGEALRGLPWVLRARRVVPAHVQSSLRRLDARLRLGARASQAPD